MRAILYLAFFATLSFLMPIHANGEVFQGIDFTKVNMIYPISESLINESKSKQKDEEKLLLDGEWVGKIATFTDINALNEKSKTYLEQYQEKESLEKNLKAAEDYWKQQYLNNSKNKQVSTEETAKIKKVKSANADNQTQLLATQLQQEKNLDNSITSGAENNQVPRKEDESLTNPTQSKSESEILLKEEVEDFHDKIAAVSNFIVAEVDAAEIEDIEFEDDEEEISMMCPAMPRNHALLTGSVVANQQETANDQTEPVNEIKEVSNAEVIPKKIDSASFANGLKEKYPAVFDPLNSLWILLAVAIGLSLHRIFLTGNFRKRSRAKIKSRYKKSEKEFVGKVFTEQGLEYFCVNQKGNGARGMKTLEELSDAVSQILGKGYRHRIVFDFLPDIKKDGNLWDFSKDNVMMLNEDERMLLTSFMNA